MCEIPNKNSLAVKKVWPSKIESKLNNKDRYQIAAKISGML